MTDTIDPRVLRKFDVCQKVGQGAYGIVFKAIHRRKGTTVALKKCFDAFRCNVDAQRTFREVCYLQALCGHENIIELQHVLRADNDRDLYITFEYMETDLSQIIKARILEPIHIQYITYQLLKALKYIHSAKLLHRDIKPSNILVDSKCSIKLCDFGLCRSISSDELPENLVLTDYIATRWYRSPEILMGSRKYTEGIDLWSAGCILGEMFRSRPLIPGPSTMGQVEKIFELTGNPTAKDVKSWQSTFATAMLENVHAKSRVRLDDLCPNLPKDAKYLIKTLFKLDPNKRGTAESALEHDYVADFHDPAKEIVYLHGPIKIGIDDNTKLTADEYRRQLYRNMKEKRGGEQQQQQQFRHEELEQQEEPNRLMDTSTLPRAPCAIGSVQARGEDAIDAVPSAVSYDSLEYQEQH
ncbi:hypothetical protein ACHAXR_009685 [Thalassiosira sp. AJA248-18]